MKTKVAKEETRIISVEKPPILFVNLICSWGKSLERNLRNLRHKGNLEHWKLIEKLVRALEED